MRRKTCGMQKNVWAVTAKEYQACGPKIIKREKFSKEKLLFLVDVLTILSDMNVYIDEIAEEAIDNEEVNFKNWDYDDLKKGVEILKNLIEKKY